MRLTENGIKAFMVRAINPKSTSPIEVHPETLKSLCDMALASLSARNEALEEAYPVAYRYPDGTEFAFSIDGATEEIIRLRALRSPELNAAPQVPESARPGAGIGGVDSRMLASAVESAKSVKENPVLNPVGAAPDRSTGGGAMPEYPQLHGDGGAMFRGNQQYVKKADYDALRQWALRRPAPSAWVSVEERLPNEDETVLICDGGSVLRGWYMGAKKNGYYKWQRQPHWEGENYGYDGENGVATEVTHWMPLPDAPEAGGRG